MSGPSYYFPIGFCTHNDGHFKPFPPRYVAGPNNLTYSSFFNPSIRKKLQRKCEYLVVCNRRLLLRHEHVCCILAPIVTCPGLESSHV